MEQKKHRPARSRSTRAVHNQWGLPRNLFRTEKLYRLCSFNVVFIFFPCGISLPASFYTRFLSVVCVCVCVEAVVFVLQFFPMRAYYTHSIYAPDIWLSSFVVCQSSAIGARPRRQSIYTY